MKVCVDASLIVKCLLYEPGTAEANAWLKAHGEDEMVAPWFLPAEVASVLRRKAHQGEITDAEAREALRLLDLLDIWLVSDPVLIRTAYELASSLGQTSVYDFLYLALAEREQCDLWTADARFAEAARPRHACVRLLGSL
jgi:predicted nucleic acid-binding protein